jgi:hypothetical protein
MSGPTIVDARNDFSQSKRWWKVLMTLQFVALTINVIAAIVSSSTLATSTLSLLALAIAVLLFVARARADAAYETGELIRHAAMFRDAIGQETPVDHTLRLRHESTHVVSTEPPIVGEYYASTLPTGPRRLAHNLFECAMATELQARRTAKYPLAVAFIGGLVAVVPLVLVAMTSQTEITSEGARAVQRNAVSIASACTTALSFFVVGTFVDAYRAFSSLVERCTIINAKLPALIRGPEPALSEVFALVDSYHFALARCPPLPAFVWRAVQPQFNAAWKEAQRSLHTESPSS